ncbi:cysteine desulfurase, variant 2 [Verruconis gallopava]|uniref:Cysteine desulfurase, variant 1 n=1 Tax=Verruconis gallopava TaxID=253628 RepID=A0A0D2AKE8_9PEZI|nr:cysteine desulfurase, variant 1 [Verruconis gallopava]XP_016209333.1 cysteine desulfurase, variant 2 [Verruconis gallopava]KIV99462.1 cysteine desulfurase, variant 1 [Verruconis gallopava]KIV99463.1 cysteine desulfurase, variant 2 [Verruconis gallopava]
MSSQTRFEGPVITRASFRIADYLSNTNVQLGATYPVGRQSTKAYTDGCKAAADYMNAAPEEIVIGPSTTQLFRNLSMAIKWRPGDELVLSKVDHEANIASWVDIASRLNLTVKWWSPEPSTNPKLDPRDLEKLLTPKTRLVTCTHTSNILGTIVDIRAIADAVHRIPAAMLCVDGVAYAPHRRIDVKALGVDFYSFSWYKVYGPHIAVLYGSEKAQEQLASLGHWFNPTTTLENKLGLAAANYELTQALPKVVEYLASHDQAETATHEARLAEVLLSYLRGREDVTVYGETSSDPDLRVPTISFNVMGWRSREVVETMEKQSDFGFRWGHFYSKRLCDEILQSGEEGVVRVSMVHYNTEDEIQRFVDTFHEIVRPK